MNRIIKNYMSAVLTVLLLLPSTCAFSSETGPEDLVGEDRVKFDRFRELFQNGTVNEFFTFANEYEQDLKEKEYMMLYYKLLNNEGFYALRHNMIYRAMQLAKRLDEELRKNDARDYYYLATGLMGDIYYASHNRKKAEAYFTQALEEVGDSDPKFTMRTCHSLAEMICIKDPKKALDWLERAKTLAIEMGNVEYQSLSISMAAYLHFLMCNSEEFFRYYDEYQSLRSMDKPGFSLRYANILEIARLAFGGKYQEASYQLANSGPILVDSSLVAIRIFAMERDIDKGFEAVKRRRLELDSLYSLSQDANFDQMATERSLLKSQKDAMDSKKTVRRLYTSLLVIVVIFLFSYIMGRRRLWMKLQQKNSDLKAALAKAEEADQMKQAFFRSMSHEIRTPLNAVAGFSQLLCKPDYKLTDEEKVDVQNRISESVHQIASIVNEVLEFSKTESETRAEKVEMSEVTCRMLAQSILNEMKGKQFTGVEMRFTSNVDDDFKLTTNPYRLKSALLHLLDNAVKFTEKGYIELACERQDDQIRFVVTDTGVGIKEEDRERIFENFTKVDDFKVGIGLGLPLSLRLVQTIGGTLKLDTSYSEGSRFVITLPIK